MAKGEKKSYGLIIFLSILAVLIISLIVLSIWQVPYVVKENYDEQVPYTTQERYTEQVPYAKQQLSYETINSANCDYISGCTCLHVSWAGLGSCDSCRCVKYDTITAYNTETKYRDVTKYRTETKQKDVTKYCSALNKLFGNCY